MKVGLSNSAYDIHQAHCIGQTEEIGSIPNAERLLTPRTAQPAHDLWEGLNVLKMHVDDSGKGWVCHKCARALRAGKLPKFSLNNNLWLGQPPMVLRRLTFAETLLIARHYARCYVFKLYPKDNARVYNHAHLQRAMAGNVTLYDVNTSVVASMLEGALLPQSVGSLSSVIAITFIGTRKLPLNWLSRTFRVRRSAVYEALQWLREHNEMYHDVTISNEQLSLLPEDEIPQEIEAVIRFEEDEGVAVKEREGYVMEDVPEDSGESHVM